MAAPRFWVGVVAGDHVPFTIREQLCAFSHGKKSAVDKLAVGDRFAYYAPKTGVGEGEVVQAFLATGAVTGEMAMEVPWAGTEMTAWAKSAAYDPPGRAEAKPLLDDLSFVTNPRYWGMAFRRSLFEISADDFKVIETAMEASRD